MYEALNTLRILGAFGKSIYGMLGFVFNTSFNFPIDSDKVEFYPSKQQSNWFLFLRTVDCNCCKENFKPTDMTLELNVDFFGTFVYHKDCLRMKVKVDKKTD
jgi:hypothetical protein